MNQPRIFLSSTVFDFSDLRSALKDHLEARGCEVFASEYPDFPKKFDQHSYGECLNTIEKSDIFLLLIGSRCGGWYDEAKKISITRAEFNHAVSLAEQGRIKIITFVRQGVWNHRQSLKELRKEISKHDNIGEEQSKVLMSHETGFMDNPEAIVEFIDAVARNKETLDASRGKGKAPVANWIHPFTTFAEVRQAIDPLIIRGLSVREAAGRKALESQLLTLLQGLLTMGRSNILFNQNLIENLIKNLNLKPEYSDKNLIIDEKNWNLLISLSSLICRASADPGSLLPALSSDLLLRYDPMLGVFHQTDEYDLLATLIEELRRFASTGPGSFGELMSHQTPIDNKKNRSVPVNLLVSELSRALRWTGAVASARSLALSLSGGPLVNPKRPPRSPYLGQETDLAAEEVTLEAVRSFVEKLKPLPDEEDS